MKRFFKAFQTSHLNFLKRTISKMVPKKKKKTYKLSLFLCKLIFNSLKSLIIDVYYFVINLFLINFNLPRDRILYMIL